MTTAPDIINSTSEERKNYIKERFPCIADCDICGICTIFHGKDAEVAYEAYIRGERSFDEVSADYRKKARGRI